MIVNLQGGSALTYPSAMQKISSAGVKVDVLGLVSGQMGLRNDGGSEREDEIGQWKTMCKMRPFVRLFPHCQHLPMCL